ncbi:hypothetical protein ACTMU2_13030 [Cupriavidus basilensis]
MMKLTDFKVLTFDCYGTLIDWETGIYNTAQVPLIEKGRLCRQAPRRDPRELRQARGRPGTDAGHRAWLYSALLAIVYRRPGEVNGTSA